MPGAAEISDFRLQQDIQVRAQQNDDTRRAQRTVDLPLSIRSTRKQLARRAELHSNDVDARDPYGRPVWGVAVDAKNGSIANLLQWPWAIASGRCCRL